MGVKFEGYFMMKIIIFFFGIVLLVISMVVFLESYVIKDVVVINYVNIVEVKYVDSFVIVKVL